MSIININKGHIFIHVPKTAGSSMEQHDGVGGSGHDTLSELMQKPDYNPDYFKWAFVRNPYDRTVSRYFQLFENMPERVGPDLEEWIYSIEMIPGFHTMPQVHFLKPLKQMDFIGRYENLDYDWGYVCTQIGINPNGLRHIYKTKHKPWQDLLDIHMKEKIVEVYAEDFKAFGYEEE